MENRRVDGIAIEAIDYKDNIENNNDTVNTARKIGPMTRNVLMNQETFEHGDDLDNINNDEHGDENNGNNINDDDYDDYDDYFENSNDGGSEFLQDEDKNNSNTYDKMDENNDSNGNKIAKFDYRYHDQMAKNCKRANKGRSCTDKDSERSSTCTTINITVSTKISKNGEIRQINVNINDNDDTSDEENDEDSDDICKNVAQKLNNVDGTTTLNGDNQVNNSTKHNGAFAKFFQIAKEKDQLENLIKAKHTKINLQRKELVQLKSKLNNVNNQYDQYLATLSKMHDE